MKTNQPTIYGLCSLVYSLFGLTPEIAANSTMNERLGILPGIKPNDTERVRLGVLVAGNAGHKVDVGAGGMGLISIEDHVGSHAAPFNPMPFCIRPVDDDLSASERRRYALRTTIEISGQMYFAYYGLRMNISREDITVNMVKVTNQGGYDNEEPFIPTNEDLNPTPLQLADREAVVASDVRLAVRCLLRLRLSATDIAEYINVAKTMYNGDERYAVMSEFGLCLGADRNVEVESSHGTVSFTESIGTQIYCHSAEFKPLYYNSQELTLDFDVGNELPLLAVASIPTIETI